MKKCCIVGTAKSWRETPWDDPAMEVWGINDAYMLGFPRVDRWYELHPMDKMWFRDARDPKVHISQVPAGHYVRPAGHLDRLKEMARTIPVFLQSAPPPDWPPNAHRFPIESVEAAFGEYWASGPAYELAQAVLEGYQEIWITGIHLETEAEYRKQRPQLEHLIGRVLGTQVTTETRDGFRFYRGAVTVVLPVASPIMQHKWRYAYEPEPTPEDGPFDREWKATMKELKVLKEQLVHWPEGSDRTKARQRLAALEVIAEDIRTQSAKQQLRSVITVVPAGV